MFEKNKLEKSKIVAYFKASWRMRNSMVNLSQNRLTLR